MAEDEDRPGCDIYGCDNEGTYNDKCSGLRLCDADRREYGCNHRECQ